ncbi:sensor histidine kinase [Geofilum rhodophaeum]|uniref:sensor histidine kinase n=1 Tax=Geofilum rhodophaeum TaxID=1965019 RepID=UPI000B520104|nr:sensor histidine kinase [Geofilum rhodophaeum]
MSSVKVNILVHALIWSAFLVFLLLFIPFYDIQLLHKPLLFFGMFLFLVAYYYFNSLFLVPRLVGQKKVVEFIVLTLLLLALYLYLSDLSGWMHMPDKTSVERILPGRVPPPPFKPERLPGQEVRPPHNPEFFPFKLSTGTVLSFLLVFMVSSGTRIIGQWLESERLKNKAEQEKSEAELSALKSQINPHFLFNTLNNIYHMSLEQSKETPETILKLANLMRFVLTETQQNQIPLAKEIEVINQYLFLQKLRLTNKTQVIFSTAGDMTTRHISPLLLLPFVENAFKYGVGAHTATIIDLALKADKAGLVFLVKNSILADHSHLESTHTGLQNVRRRLQLIYPNQHKLEIIKQENWFKVLLTIKWDQ